jgi:hypothetical protein
MTMRHVSLILQAHQANCTVLIVYYGNNDTLALIIKLRGETTESESDRVEHEKIRWGWRATSTDQPS